MRAKIESGLVPLNKDTAPEYMVALRALGKPVPQELSEIPYGRSFGGGSGPDHVVDVRFASQVEPIEFRLKKNKGAEAFNIILRLLGLGVFAFTGYLIWKMVPQITEQQKVAHQQARAVKTKLSDVIGLAEAKQEVQILVDFLKDPRAFKKMGARMPKGLILYGPPGVGKTHLARGMAGEAGVNFYFVSAAAVEEMYVGLGALRVRNLFEEAKKNSPSIIFIDEIDAIGAKRKFTQSRYENQTLNQVLTLMDGFSDYDNVLVIAATNAAEQDLDDALLRSGRFDKKVTLHPPMVDDRRELFRYFLGKVPTLPEAERDTLARGMASVTWGCSGADVSNIVNQASILAVQRKRKYPLLADLQDAHYDVQLGPENKSMKQTEQEKLQTAYHEAGHTIVALFAPGASPPRQVTITPRGNALGFMSKDVSDRVSMTLENYRGEIATAMGGRVAEELIYGLDKVTSGAQSDFMQATKIAEAMVSSFGLSSMGVMSLPARTKESVSEETKKEVDSSIRQILSEQYEKARQLLEEKQQEHHRLALALMKYETLTYDEIVQVVKGKTINRT